MHFSTSLAAPAIAFLLSGVGAAPTSDAPKLSKRCTHSATDRSCWGDYDLSTNYYDVVPDTGVVRDYYLELVNTTAALDGVERNVLLVNGTFPGPTLFADWGDTVRVTLYNGLANNGTGLHFHGIRQNYTNQMDGVPSITQCAIAPEDTMVYEWRATQYGSTWYHSHFALQAWEGVLGGIIINGPATANYEVDSGMLFLNDWTHETVDYLYHSAQASGPPTLDNGLINGTNVYNETGSRFEMDFVAGTSYRLRLVNGAIDSMFKFSIDNHTMTVIAADLVPIVPYSADVISIGMGQRYDVIINATETTGDFWMRAIPQTSCSDNDNADNIRGIIRYDSSSTSDPTTTGYDYEDNCNDEAMGSLIPYLAIVAEEGALAEDSAVTVGKVNSLFKWYMNATSFAVEWDNPTVSQIVDGNTSFTSSQHVIKLDEVNSWVYFIIETAQAVAHPIHLHGHDFWVLAQGTGTYASAAPVLQLTDSPRRDVVTMPASGYVVIAFITDNPGAWLMHCHIGWHTSEGFALQMVERMDEIAAITDSTTLNDHCDKWSAYAEANDIVVDDSGV